MLSPNGGALSGLVLCGGRSSRMGRDKALIDWEGSPLVLHVATRLATIAHPVLLASGQLGRLGEIGYRELADGVEGAGPLAGVAAGLEASPHELMAVVAVDMPWMSPEVMRLLASLWAEEDAVVPTGPDGPEPLHAVYARGAIYGIRRALASEDRSMRGVLDDVRTRHVAMEEWQVADPSGGCLTNLNSPQDM